MGPKYLQVGFGKLLGYGRGERKLSCNSVRSIISHRCSLFLQYELHHATEPSSEKTFIITSKLLSDTTKTTPVINPAFVFKLCAEYHPQRGTNRSGQLSRSTKRRQGPGKFKKRKKITCANSHLAIAVVFTLQRMLASSHFCSLPASVAVFSTVVQEFNWSTVIAREPKK